MRSENFQSGVLGPPLLILLRVLCALRVRHECAIMAQRSPIVVVSSVTIPGQPGPFMGSSFSPAPLLTPVKCVPNGPFADQRHPAAARRRGRVTRRRGIAPSCAKLRLVAVKRGEGAYP
jgi:hypothetical protein